MAIPPSTVQFDRWELHPGVVAWIYRYASKAPKAKDGLGAGLEFGAQVQGHWRQHSSSRRRAHYAAGTIHRLDGGERYVSEVSASGPSDVCVQVGFIVYPHRTGLHDSSVVLRFDGDSGLYDVRLMEVARDIATAGTIRTHERASLTQEVLAYVQRHAISERPDPLSAAKLEIDANPGPALYVRHLAEIADMHPETFSRAFKRRFGLTPVRYRLRTRLNLAANLGWRRPDLSFEEIAALSGFDDKAYFYRAFRHEFRVSPAQHSRRQAASTRPKDGRPARSPLPAAVGRQQPELRLRNPY